MIGKFENLPKKAINLAVIVHQVRKFEEFYFIFYAIDSMLLFNTQQCFLFCILLIDRLPFARIVGLNVQFQFLCICIHY